MTCDEGTMARADAPSGVRDRDAAAGRTAKIGSATPPNDDLTFVVMKVM
jgi:hypothetical protein